MCLSAKEEGRPGGRQVLARGEFQIVVFPPCPTLVRLLDLASTSSTSSGFFLQLPRLSTANNATTTPAASTPPINNDDGGPSMFVPLEPQCPDRPPVSGVCLACWNRVFFHSGAGCRAHTAAVSVFGGRAREREPSKAEAPKGIAAPGGQCIIIGCPVQT